MVKIKPVQSDNEFDWDEPEEQSSDSDRTILYEWTAPKAPLPPGAEQGVGEYLEYR